MEYLISVLNRAILLKPTVADWPRKWRRIFLIGFPITFPLTLGCMLVFTIIVGFLWMFACILYWFVSMWREE